MTINGGSTFSGFSGPVSTTNLTLSNGTLTAPSGAFTVTGNWSASPSSTFNPGTNLVTFNEGGAATIDSGGLAFFNLAAAGSGSIQLINNALTANGTFTETAGSFNANGQANTVAGLTTISGGATYSALSAAQTFSGGLTLNNGTFTGGAGFVTTSNVSIKGTLTAPSGAFTVSGNWTFTSGTFTPGSNTVTFNGTGTQAVDLGGRLLPSFIRREHSAG